MASITTTLKTTKATSIGTAFNGGSATMQLRTGSPPGAGAAPSGTLLCTITLPSTCFTVPSVNGVLSKTGTWSGTVTTGGTCGHFRIVKGSDIIEGTVGTSGQEINFSTNVFVLDGVVTIDTFTYTVS
jgi:hypothetical protein